jgi:hypothetical protein
MSVKGPRVKCHKCGATNLIITGTGLIPVHNAKDSNVMCVGSLEPAK